MQRSKLIKWVLALVAAIAFAGLVWWLMQPPPMERGDRRWCKQIADKPTDTWSVDEALGYAQENCMRWHFIEDLKKARDAEEQEKE